MKSIRNRFYESKVFYDFIAAKSRNKSNFGDALA